MKREKFNTEVLREAERILLDAVKSGELQGTESPPKFQLEENKQLEGSAARYVDSILTRLHSKLPEQPPLTIAVLAALMIAEDFLAEREKNRSGAQSQEEIKRIVGEPSTSFSQKTDLFESAIASERSLAKDWLRPEEDAAWQNL